MTLWLHGCPRCRGTLMDDSLDGQRHCLSCGWYDYQPMSCQQAQHDVKALRGMRLSSGPRAQRVV